MGDAHERRVFDALNDAGWSVGPWGQGCWPAEVRRAIQATDSLMRWAPDLIASRDDEIVLVDCKGRATSRDTGRHSIEKAAVRAHLAMHGMFFFPVYYVFEDLSVLTPDQVNRFSREGPRRCVGSRTPYVLVDAYRAEPFNAVFGARSYSPEAA